MLETGKRTMPKATGKNSTIVRDILADLKSEALSRRDTSHPSLDLNDMILNLPRLRGTLGSKRVSTYPCARDGYHTGGPRHIEVGD
jgi:hypothetical protein